MAFILCKLDKSTKVEFNTRSHKKCLGKDIDMWVILYKNRFNYSLEVIRMKLYRLKRKFNGYKKGTEFYLIAESEFIGVKEFVLRTTDLRNTIIINESDLIKNFALMYS